MTMDDDVQLDDFPCPNCGHHETRFKHCYDCDENNEVTDCCDDLCQGETCIHGDYKPCPECNGHGIIRWCSKCGKDIDLDRTPHEQLQAEDWENNR